VVRVFDANVDQSEIFNDGYVKAIERQRPDVIALEEFTPQALWSMKNSGVLASYPYQCTSPTPGATGFLVASKLRLTDCQIKNTGYNDTSMQYMQYMVEATLSTPAGPVALRVVHPLRRPEKAAAVAHPRPGEDVVEVQAERAADLQVLPVGARPQRRHQAVRDGRAEPETDPVGRAEQRHGFLHRGDGRHGLHSAMTP